MLKCHALCIFAPDDPGFSPGTYFSLMKILVFDNYDSFTYNLVHQVKKLVHGKVEVWKNDEISLASVKSFDKIILSPGPGLPKDAGLLEPLIREYAATKSILGVCLGHQAIGEVFGGRLINLDHVFHGVSTECRVVKKNAPLFRNMPLDFMIGRYHSWVISEESFPEEMEITARDENNYIMALQHRQFDVQGVQFHPESVLTPLGEKILENWLLQ